MNQIILASHGGLAAGAVCKCIISIVCNLDACAFCP